MKEEDILTMKHSSNQWTDTFVISIAGKLQEDISNNSDLLDPSARLINEMKDCMFGINDEDGSKYKGQIDPKMRRHGYGELTDCYGNRYEGNFNAGKKEDDCASIFYKKSEATFLGKFKNDRICPASRGILTLKDGTHMEGSFMVISPKLGTFRGIGVTVFDSTSGNKYIGDIKANKIEGLGRMEYSNGDIYKGSWQNGMRCGKGEIRYANRDVYKGFWKNDKRHGKGILDLASYDRYDGHFQNDMIEGKGVYLGGNGSKYEGYFFKNQRCGTGIAISPDKRISCGQWKDDKLHGRGYREYLNGDKYYGLFKDSKRNGAGEMLFEDGALLSGLWGEGRILEGKFDLEQAELSNTTNKSVWPRFQNNPKPKLSLFGAKNKSRITNICLTDTSLPIFHDTQINPHNENLQCRKQFIGKTQVFIKTIEKNSGSSNIEFKDKKGVDFSTYAEESKIAADIEEALSDYQESSWKFDSSSL